MKRVVLMENGPLAWALEWARRGFRVFPLQENTKNRPLWDGWTETASSDPAQIKKWWTIDTPDGPMIQAYNIGVLTSGGLVVDIDIKSGKHGMESWFGLHGEFNTLTIRTPSNGLHLYFRAPFEVANSQGDQKGGIAPGIDVRGWHGYVVGPGSIVDGKYYALENDVPLAEAPPEVLDLCRAPGPRLRDTITAPLVELDTQIAINMAIDVATRAEPGVTGQGHNHSTYALACKVRDCGVSEERAVEIIDEYRNVRSVPPLPLEELAAIIENAYRYARNPEGIAHPAASFGDVVVEPAVYTPVMILGEASESLDGWGNLIPMSKLRPRPWILRWMMLRGEVTALIAPGGVGKSQLILTIAVYLALGKDCWKFKNMLDGPKRSIIYNAEDTLEEMSMRLHATCTAMQIHPDQVGPYIRLVSGKQPLKKSDDKKKDARLRLVTLDENKKPKLNSDAIDGIVELASHPDCVMVSFDPLLKIHEVAENDNQQMGYVMETLDLIATRADVAILLAVHTAKPSAASSGSYVGNSDSARGAGAIRDSVRVAFTLSPPTDDDVAKYGLSPSEKSHLLRIDDAKFNRALLGNEPVWIEKHEINLVCGEEVGAFLEANLTDRSDNLRRRIGTILGTELRQQHKASMPFNEAFRVLRRHDPIWEKLDDKDARQRLDQLFVRPIEMEDGGVLDVTTINSTKTIVLK